ncbi:selenium-dependent xanthine dehydrogenase [Oscillibacter hominis]|uniref:Selenium-dependent xanthine dehydrogenase n=1 Tax=Oscillibacter hominis TaxID=2763056 RepID=A0A7G9B733_9FIRM|nr:selenium-dependent xanthine dehydrogenase [Oscillibacter hominis]QNL45364.1 selenium-dependent xanthine dehydrogenase [Oscillibacter hominis]
MATFTVNGRVVSVEKNQKLLRYLRDELHLTSVKDGCSEGACGTCHVLIDGKATKACIPQTDKLEGKAIVTVEGLSDFEKEVYTYAFGKAGAVQCGFCIPGMVISAKALLDMNPDPTEEEVAYAIRNNICRCTGYVKIIQAILLAAEVFRIGEVPRESQEWKVGARVPRIDVREKVTGTGQYPDDVYLDGMIYASAVRSAYPRAIVKAIHTEEARALPGVVGVFTAADVPGINKVGHLVKDWDTMIAVGDTTHYLGDAIALVAAEDRETLEKAKALVQVDYEVLESVRSAEEARAENAPLVHRTGNLLAHRHIHRGNAAFAIAKSKHVLTRRFHTPYTEHAFLEPECAVAYPDGDGVMVLSSDQGTYDTQQETMRMLGLGPDQVKVRNMLVGGGFGGKEDVTVQHHAALVAYLTKRPVKVKLSRAESILIHPKRHPMDMEFALGCDENGIIQGVAAQIIADTGAYASLGGPVLERACTHAAGPYNYQNFEIDGYAYYTNNPPAGAFRGFGVTQSCFAIESLLNEMADVVGISPWEIRYRNAIRPGQELPNGQIVDESTGLVETLEAIKPYYDSAKYAGLACAMKNAGVGVGIPDTGRVRLAVQEGKVHIYAGASCIGQGLGTVLTQTVCGLLSIPPEQVVYEHANTYESPDSGTTSGSRQTLFTGEACRRACESLLNAMKEKSLTELEGREFRGTYLGKTDPLGADVPNPVSHIAYGYATQMCELNEDGTIRQIVAAHDVGRAVNPLSVEGQIEGGVVMSMGFALTEQYPLTDCRPTAKFGTLGLFRAHQVPQIKAIVVEKDGLKVGGGAIGIGEITSIPTAPAIADAYYRYDGKRRSALPLEDTPYSRK